MLWRLSPPAPTPANRPKNTDRCWNRLVTGRSVDLLEDPTAWFQIPKAARSQVERRLSRSW